MKKLYTLLMAVLVLPATLAAQGLTTGRVYAGYATNNEKIWEYDGLSMSFDAKVGCAIVLTKDMLRPYIGGTITGMRVGWDTSEMTGTCEGFVRRTFNGEDLTTGKATVRYIANATNAGWNDMPLHSYEIPEDVDQLVVGFTTTLKKDVCAIPLLYPHGVPNSCYLWVEGDYDAQGNPHWLDMCDRGKLAILLTIRDSKGTFNSLPVITMVTDNGVGITDEPGDVLIAVRNMGSQPIKDIEVTSKIPGDEWSQTIPATISVGATSKPFLAPIFGFRSGDVELSITQANGQQVADPKSHKANLLVVPEEVARKYTRRPLVEYYESENNYRSARYYDDVVEAPVMNMGSKITFVCQHLDDQFMTGDDDATKLALRLCDGDSAQVGIPAVTIDRAMATDNILFQQNSTPNPMFDALYDPYATQALNAAIARPTFVAVNAEGNLGADGETLTAHVGGDIARGILPEGERLRLTVYLMERDVESDSQIFWNEKEKEGYSGKYTHANVIREILSAPEGDAVNEGDFEADYKTYLAPEWNTENLYLVAFVHRDGKLGGRRMHVLNSTKGNIDLTDGIEGVLGSEFGEMVNGKWSNGKWSNGKILYDLTGRRITKPAKGLYIRNGKKFIK